MTAPTGIFGAVRSASYLARVEQVPMSSTLEPGDRVAMDNLPPPAPCYVAQLFGLTVEELSGQRDVSGGKYPPPSELPLTL